MKNLPVPVKTQRIAFAKDIESANVVEERNDVRDATQHHDLHGANQESLPVRDEERLGRRTYRSRLTHAATILLQHLRDAGNEHGHGEQTRHRDEEVNHGGDGLLLGQVLHDDLLDASRVAAEVDGGDRRQHQVADAHGEDGVHSDLVGLELVLLVHVLLAMSARHRSHIEGHEAEVEADGVGRDADRLDEAGHVGEEKDFARDVRLEVHDAIAVGEEENEKRHVHHEEGNHQREDAQPRHEGQLARGEGQSRERLDALNAGGNEDNGRDDDVEVQIAALLSSEEVLAPVEGLHVVRHADLWVRAERRDYHCSEQDAPHRNVVDAEIQVVAVPSVQLVRDEEAEAQPGT